MRSLMRLAVGICLGWMLARQPVARADPVVQFDSIVLAKYSFLNKTDGQTKSSTAPSATYSPSDIGVTDPNGNPTYTGMLGMSAAGNTLIVKAKRSIDEGANSGSQPGNAIVSVTALFEVVRDPANPNALYNVSEQDMLRGMLHTSLNTGLAGSGAEALGKLTTTVSTATYIQNFSVSDDGKTFNLTHFKPSVGNLDKPTPDFQFAPGANDSTINYDSGPLFLTTVRGGQQFTVTAELETDVLAIGAGSVASSNFFDTGTLTLTASVVPEPGVLVLFGVGAPILAASLRRRRIS